MLPRWLSSDGEIVHSPDFENAVVKLIDDEVDDLDITQKGLLDRFRRANNRSAGVASPVKPDTPYTIRFTRFEEEKKGYE